MYIDSTLQLVSIKWALIALVKGESDNVWTNYVLMTYSNGETGYLLTPDV